MGEIPHARRELLLRLKDPSFILKVPEDKRLTHFLAYSAARGEEREELGLPVNIPSLAVSLRIFLTIMG